LEAVKKGEYTFDIPEFKGVSDGAKDLIRNCVCNVEHRFTADKVL